MTTLTSPIMFEDIWAAARRIKGGVVYTPCPYAELLSQAVGCEVYCKLDYLQRTGSFKERGARNALLQLPEEKRKNGVIAASAGNHALGLAYHGKQLGIPVTVVMPKFAPMTKISNCRKLGAKVVLAGDHLENSRQFALEIMEKEGSTYIHGFDDPAVIAGQGTMGLEILEQVPDVEAIVVPVGGAGLIAGLALAVKTMRPSVQVIGVEPIRAASFAAALAAGKPVQTAITPTLADGLAVACVGANAFELARKHVDKVVTVSEREIALAVLRLVEMQRGVVEGAGATGLAAAIAGKLPELAGKKVVFPLCGGNLDTPVLGRIIERGLAADGRLCRFEVGISDRPGGLAKLATLIAAEGASFRDISHDRTFGAQDLASVNVHCVVETDDVEHIKRIHHRLVGEGFSVKFYDWTL